MFEENENNGNQDRQRAMMDMAKVRMDVLESVARKQGLYLQGFDLGVDPRRMQHPSDLEGATVVISSFLVGQEAFSDRVLHPDRFEDDTVVRQMEQSVDEAGMIAERLRRNREEGKDVWGED